MNPTLFNLTSIFFLHALSLLVLCPSRYGNKKTIGIWSGAMLLSMGCGVVLLQSFYLTGAYIALTITIFVYVGTMIFLSVYEAPKTLFLFLVYGQAFMVLVFLISMILSRACFGNNPIAMSTIRNILHIVLIILCGKVFRSKFDLQSQGIQKGWWPLNVMAFLLLCYLGIFIVYSANKGYEQMGIVLFILLLAMSVAVYWVFFHTIDCMHNAAMVERLELQSEFLMSQVASMQELIETAKRTSHDARHHNLQIIEYVQNGERDALLHYLNQYEEELKSHIPVKFCDNIAANNILNAYVRKAEKAGIMFRYQVSLEQEIGIKDTDIVAILANLMENAVFGCLSSRHPKPFIELLIGHKAGKLVIQSRNTADMKTNSESSRFPVKQSEGIGISSILHSVDNYGGETDFQNDNGIFQSRILLKLPKN